ncbi:MAG: hypothetical protein KDB22_12295, partial [Planctomycetales bacterium]|nr:hypothetical protein [Planctomycetales bacterium]
FARSLANRPCFLGAQQGSTSQPQLGAISQPQLGAASQQVGAASQQVGAGAQQLGATSQPQLGATSQQLEALRAAHFARIRAKRPWRGAAHGSQQVSTTSQPQLGAISQPQLGIAISQPQLGAVSQQLDARLPNKPAFALVGAKHKQAANAKEAKNLTDIWSLHKSRYTVLGWANGLHRWGRSDGDGIHMIFASLPRQTHLGHIARNFSSGSSVDQRKPPSLRFQTTLPTGQRLPGRINLPECNA